MMKTARGTYQKTLCLEEHAQVPSAVTIRLALVDDDGVQKTFATDSGDHGVVDVLQTLTELLAHSLSALNHVLLLNKLKSTDSDC
jgi:hypothetical protein